MIIKNTVRPFLVALSLFVAFLAILPDFWAYTQSPSGYSFVGVNLASNIDDIFGNYYASMLQSVQGSWLYINPFDFHSTAFVHYSLYFLLGKLAYLFHWPISLIYLLAGFLLAFLFSFFLLNFLRLFLKEKYQVYVGFILCNFGAVYPLAAPESNAFFSYKFPHYTVSLWALFCSIFFLLRYGEKGKHRDLVGLAAVVIVFGFIHPWMCIPLVLAYLVWRTIYLRESVFSRQVIFPIGVIIAIFVPISFYYKLHMSWIDYRYSQSPLLIFGLFGAILLLSVVGLWRLREYDRKNPVFFLGIWFAVELVFCYLPLPFARRYYEGLFLPVSVLGVIGLTYLVQKIVRDFWMGYVFIPLFLCVGTVSSYLAHFVWGTNAQIYRHREEFMIAETLSPMANLNTRVLALPSSSIFLAGHLVASYYVGHEIQTPDFKNKSNKSTLYYLGKMNKQEREQFVRREDICYVYFGEDEKAISKINLENEIYLKPVIRKGDFSAYRSVYCNNNE